MKQLEFFTIQSPCIGVCESGPNGFCLGCFRSRDERRYWNECPSEVKHKIVVACGKRKRRHEVKQRKSQFQKTPIQGSLLDEDAQGNLFDDE